jgi:hypothetical protein
MPNATSVTLTNGVPTGPAGAATVSTIDALMADGGQVTIGAKADAAVTSPSTAGSLVALLKGLLSMLGTVAGGAAGSVSALIGGVYRSAYPTALTNGQQAALGIDALGGLLIVGSRPLPIFNSTLKIGSTAYTAAMAIGSLSAGGGSAVITLSGFPANTQLSSLIVHMRTLSASMFTAGSISPVFFNAAPTTAFLDGSAVALVAADLPIAFNTATVAAQEGGLTLDTVVEWTFTAPRINTDAVGNIYLVLLTNTNVTFISTSDAIAIEADGTY